MGQCCLTKTNPPNEGEQQPIIQNYDNHEKWHHIPPPPIQSFPYTKSTPILVLTTTHGPGTTSHGPGTTTFVSSIGTPPKATVTSSSVGGMSWTGTSKNSLRFGFETMIPENSIKYQPITEDGNTSKEDNIDSALFPLKRKKNKQTTKLTSSPNRGANINIKLPKKTLKKISKTTQKKSRKKVNLREKAIKYSDSEHSDSEKEEREKYNHMPVLLNDSSKSSQMINGAHPPHIKDYHREKSNSTSTLFLNSKLEAPDVNEVIQCMSVALFWGIRRGWKKKKPKLENIWSEVSHKLSNSTQKDLTNPPSIYVIQEFLKKIFATVELSAECGVMAIAYIDRLLVLTGLTLHPQNWRRVVLGALLIASKVWEDQAMWNSDFLRAFPQLQLRDLSDLEIAYLTKVQFCLTLKASVYAKYYFELRSLSEKDECHFPLKPLNEKGQQRLLMRSIGQRKLVEKKMLRSESTDHYKLPERPVTLKM